MNVPERANRKLLVEDRDISTIFPCNTNARMHPKAQIEKLASNISKLGFSNPILVEGDGTIISGHGRYLAAKKLNLKTVPVITIDDLTPEEVRAHRLADNRLGDGSRWDPEILNSELASLRQATIDLSATGFALKHIKIARPPLPGLVESGPMLPQFIPGTLWKLGHHRLHCVAHSSSIVLGRSKVSVTFSKLQRQIEAASESESVYLEPVTLLGALKELGSFPSRHFIHTPAELLPELLKTIQRTGHFEIAAIFAGNRFPQKRPNFHPMNDAVVALVRRGSDVPVHHPKSAPQMKYDFLTEDPLIPFLAGLLVRHRKERHEILGFLGIGTSLMFAAQLAKRQVTFVADSDECRRIAFVWMVDTGEVPELLDVDHEL